MLIVLIYIPEESSIIVTHVQIIVDNHLCSVSDPKRRIYALGDCAHIQGQSIPCTAQAAEKQGRYLARALSDIFGPAEREPKPFTFKSFGMLAYVGGYQAIHDLPLDKSKGKDEPACLFETVD